VSIADVVRRRGITEIVHFTMSKGLLGILACGAALSRVRITDEEILEFIARVNAERVIDGGYEDYVNLSISEINYQFFDISSRKWHPKSKWAVLAFDPDILGHEDVVFVTTNNGYPARRRAAGEKGLEALFAPIVLGYYSQERKRTATMPDNLTTDEQAEVLYPKRLSTEYLRAVYVRDGDFQDQVHAHFGAAGHPDVEIIVAPERFESRGGRVL
jgi:ssDNA thymidine ADP-ribosyltransferase DarT-like protein